MKMKLASLLVLTLPVVALAEDKVDQRQENQEQRIEQGVQSGELNQKEAARLNRQQNRIEKAEGKAEADGKVTRKERKRLNQMQNHASRDIYRQKHDRQKRRR